MQIVCHSAVGLSSDAPAPRRLRRLQDADLDGKVVLVRVDHNCVRRGSLTDAFRVDATVATLYNIVERGGRPILMTHVGRPYDKKTHSIRADEGDAVVAVARYLQSRLGVTFAVLRSVCLQARTLPASGFGTTGSCTPSSVAVWCVPVVELEAG